MAYTWKETQQSLRKALEVFLEDNNMKERLARFKGEPQIFDTVVYFLSQYYNAIVDWPDKRKVRANEMYRAAMTRMKKRFFDFGSRPDRKSELVWDGQSNPEYEVMPGFKITLPRATALRWFITNGMDIVFWQQIDEIQSRYEEHKAKTKAFYRNNHTEKKQKLRDKIIGEIIGTRKTKKKGKNTYLTRPERRLVSSRLRKIQESEKRGKRHGGQAGRKNKSLQLQSPKLICAIIKS